MLIDSDSIAALAYDSNFHVLAVEFRETGSVYLYFEVPAEDYEAFLAAESKGEYLNRVFKPKGYRYTGPHPSTRQAA